MTDSEDRLKLLETEIERRLVERFAALRDEFDRLRLESDSRWAGFVDRFEQKFSGIVPQELLAGEPEPSPASGGIAAQAARSLDEAASQVDALQCFLDLCRQHASRAALLVTRGGSLGVWKAVGFSEHEGSDEAARHASLPSASEGALGRVLEGHPCELPGHNTISSALSAADVSRAILIPMVVKERISGALYADCVAAEESQFDAEALGLLTFLSGLVVDRLASRKLKPAPALQPLEAFAEAAESKAPPTPAEPEFELAEEAAQPEPQRRAPEMEKIRRPEPSAPAPPGIAPSPGTQELVPEEPRRPTQAPFARPSREEESAPSKPEPELDLAPEPSELLSSGATMRISSSALEPAPSAPARDIESVRLPPPAAPPSPPRISTGVRRLAGPLAPLDGDERREEARRFAKLLVSEIKLYNEKAVQQGRQQGNVYELLKEDIDRSRQMYDERIPEDVRAGSNFFYEELVRILADGRADALGL